MFGLTRKKEVPKPVTKGVVKVPVNGTSRGDDYHEEV